MGTGMSGIKFFRRATFIPRAEGNDSSSDSISFYSSDSLHGSSLGLSCRGECIDYHRELGGYHSIYVS